MRGRPCALRLLTTILVVTRVVSGWSGTFKGVAIHQGTHQAVAARLSMTDPEAPFKYVILGGGTAGCALANRLTADKSNTVLLLEAGTGKSEVKMIQVPAGFLRLFRSNFDWIFESEKEPHTEDRGIYIPRGKVLGGSSCLNSMLYHRGTAADYDSWGVSGWNSTDVLQYFKRAEDNRTFKRSEYHSKGGPYSVEYARYKNPLCGMFLEACKKMGLPSNNDFNDWTKPQDGYGRYQVTQKFGRRVTAASAYLRRVRRRRNLRTETNAMGTRVLFEGKVAVGVEYVQNGEKHVARVADGGEVLLCGGAVNSPQLLMLSGVGPAEHLEEKGIAVIEDLPGVGKNLQDHPAVTVMNDITKPIAITDQIFRKKGKTRPHLSALWYFLGRGPLTSPGCDHGGFFKSTAAHSQPDLQLRFVPGRAETPDGVQGYRNLGLWGQENSGVTIQVVGCRPKSRGHLLLRSADPFEKPEITLNYFEEPEDLATLTSGIKMARSLFASNSFKDVMSKEIFPGLAASSDDLLGEYVRRTCHSSNAVVGTCKMSSDITDTTGVVDEKLCVRGIKGLRIVDASIIPCAPGGQAGASVIMIAEKAADLILERSPPASISV